MVAEAGSSFVKGFEVINCHKTVININKIGGFGGKHKGVFTIFRAAEKLISSDLNGQQWKTNKSSGLMNTHLVNDQQNISIGFS